MKTIKLLFVLAFTLICYSNSLQAQCWISASDSGGYYCTKTVNLGVFDQNLSGYTIYWGDGSSTNSNNNFGWEFYNHTYASTGFYFPYIVDICGDTSIPGLGLNNANYYYVTDSCAYISGKAFVDNNGNCFFDGGDHAIANKLVTASINGNIISAVYTDNNGDYLLPCGNGLNQITITPLPSTSSSCGTSTTASVLGNSFYDFKFSCNPGFDLEANISSTAFPQTNFLWVPFQVTNYSCQTTNTSFTITLDSKIIANQNMGYASTNGVPVTLSYANNVVSASNVNIAPYAFVSGYLFLKADSTTNLGDTLCLTIEATPIVGDLNPANNTKTTCAQVVTSYDPNIKVVKIEGKPAEGFVSANKVMEYTVFFQNTGNYPAKDVRITDVISPNLDVHSLAFVASSHPCNLMLSGSNLTVYFNNIWLADSVSNEPESHGYVTFTINQLPGLAPGTEIHNTADIYFDYNAPITTNTVISIIEYPASVPAFDAQANIRLFPNPASEYLTLVNSGTENMYIHFYDVSGKCLKTVNGNGTMQLPVYDLPAGFYMLTVQSETYSLPYKILITR